MAILLALIATMLLLGPVWVEIFHLDDRVYRYERAEVVTDGNTIQYASEANDPGVAISDDIACSAAVTSRSCYLERGLIGNRTAPTSKYTSGNAGPVSIESPYRYVIGQQAIYSVETVLNDSQGYIVENGSVKPIEKDSSPNDRILYRVELDLQQVSPAHVLDRVTLDVGDVDGPIQEAARTGSVKTYQQLDIPQTSVKLDDGSIYRVYLAATHGPPETAQTAVVFLRFLAPLAGLFLGYAALKRFHRHRAN